MSKQGDSTAELCLSTLSHSHSLPRACNHEWVSQCRWAFKSKVTEFMAITVMSNSCIPANVTPVSSDILHSTLPALASKTPRYLNLLTATQPKPRGSDLQLQQRTSFRLGDADFHTCLQNVPAGIKEPHHLQKAEHSGDMYCIYLQWSSPRLWIENAAGAWAAVKAALLFSQKLCSGMSVADYQPVSPHIHLLWIFLQCDFHSCYSVVFTVTSVTLVILWIFMYHNHQATRGSQYFGSLHE